MDPLSQKSANTITEAPAQGKAPDGTGKSNLKYNSWIHG